MDITLPAIRSLNTAVSTAFNIAWDAAPTVYDRFTMTVPSTAAETMYPRLDQIPGLREWIGDRIIHSLGISTYSIRNRTFEETISIGREQFEDDQFGILNPVVGELGMRAKQLPDLLIAQLMAGGHTTIGNDGQNFFDTSHPNWNPDGSTTTAANYVAGAGPFWYLFDTSRTLKPLVFQDRRPFRLIPLTNPSEFMQFMENRFVWGVDGRCNAGLGMWQLAFASGQPLTGANYAAARAAMMAFRRPDGAPIGITPNLLVTGPSLEATARKLLLGDYDIDSGAVIASNPWKGSAEYLKSPWIP